MNGSIACWTRSTPAVQPLSGKYVQVIADERGCALNTVGKIECWGQRKVPQGTYRNIGAKGPTLCGVSTGQMMSCDMTDWSTGVVGTFSKVSVTAAAACALEPGGRARCWTGHQLYTFRETASTPPHNDYIDISVNGDLNGWSWKACGIRRNRDVSCWPYGNSADQQAQSQTGPFKSLSVGEAATHCGIRMDDTVKCWVRFSYQQVLTPPAGAYQQVSVGGIDACAVRKDGTIVCGQGAESTGFGRYAPTQ
jgi:hypothetical protein